MIGKRQIGSLAAAAAVPLAALALAACGDSSNNASAVTPTTASGRTATVGVANDSNLGKILVDSKGRTLYLFLKDAGTKSECSGACANAWPPVREAGKPAVGSGLTSSKVGTTGRSDGKRQLTYGGHPLYRYTGDQEPGDTNGQGLTAFGAAWDALSPSGNRITGDGGNSGGGSIY